MIVKLAVHYEQQRVDEHDDNNGLLYGIYYYDIPKEDYDKDNMFDNEIVHVEWYKTVEERNKMLVK